MKMIEPAKAAWLSGATMRARRRRYKDFTYGRQWGDPCRASDGRRMTEEQRMEEEGRIPITNNIIRQMVKSIVGRWRYLSVQTDLRPEDAPLSMLARALDGSAGRTADTDARTLEEFLISGTAVQRVEPDGAEAVSLERFFYTPFFRADGSDCRLMGMLHDMAPAEVMRRFAGGDPLKAAAVKEAFARRAPGGAFFGSGAEGDIDFDRPAAPGTWRVVELWERVGSEWLEVYDPFSRLIKIEEPSALPRLEGLNKARRGVGSAPLEWEYAADDAWRVRWLTPDGELLCEDKGGEPPFVLRFYPMIDGEVHSLVEDVVHQQKYVNRLISLLDHIISSSAKGVLLYPADQLPDGFTWRDLRRIWSTPNGIMPYKRTARGVSPEQVHTGSAVGAGAADMLRTQLQLFEEISGSTGALRGSSASAAGEGMFRAELENATVSLLDVLAAFRAFVRERDEVMEAMKEYERNEEKSYEES